ncbi:MULTISPECIES: DUF4233 domain-containing protein [unclassified Brachybacterium]|uniref:DUF4233 domain-containing protein n=1 Tax=unclassified Brachybacterium TaxID=2623841 RepID=UPI0036165A55
MPLDLAPSRRAHGAQRALSATILVIEAFVVFFAVLVAHQLVPDQRTVTWVWGLVTALALVLCSGLLRRAGWPYLLGMVLQLPVILLGLQVTAMWVVGLGFAGLYVFGVFKGHQLDREKDAVDARVRAARGPGDEPDGEGSAG